MTRGKIIAVVVLLIIGAIAAYLMFFKKEVIATNAEGSGGQEYTPPTPDSTFIKGLRFLDNAASGAKKEDKLNAPGWINPKQAKF